jgi:hypothetical protein
VVFSTNQRQEEHIMPYEFSKKEVRSEFKTTTFGKQINLQVYVSNAIAALCVIITVFMYFNRAGAHDNNFFAVLENNTGVFVMIMISFILIVSACYFDGMRDGAITQFKEHKKDVS